jgi:hypothetical protein
MAQICITNTESITQTPDTESVTHAPDTESVTQAPDTDSILKEAFTSLRDKGYMKLNLIDIGILKESEVTEMQEICMSEYYKFFTDKGLDHDAIKIDLESEMKTNHYFKQPKDSDMFKAMYGGKTKDGRDYINTRAPANSRNCGMGSATSQKSTYYHPRLNELREKLRHLMTSLYSSPVKRNLTRFGIKLPPSKDMALHTDMSYIQDYRDNAPERRGSDDPVSYSPYDNTGRPQRLQFILGLNNSEAGWYGYEGAHKKYAEIGDALNWPGKTKTIQTIPIKLMKTLGLNRVDVPTRFGEAVIWNCGVPHGNSACSKVPRLVLYVNYQPDVEQTTADHIIGLGNQPRETTSSFGLHFKQSK